MSAASYGYDPVQRLSCLRQDLAGGSTLDCPSAAASGNDWLAKLTYNPASQIATRTHPNDAYAWTGHYNVARGYTTNGLNQYTSAGPAGFSYDANGNLVSDGTTTFSYDVENRLTGASGVRTASLVYDPMGRLFETSGGSAGTTRFLYDGDALAAEYDGSGNLLRRYVHGPGVDEPLVWYEGSAVSSGTRRYLHANHQGSIVAISDSGGALIQIDSYDPYGIAAPTNIGRFQYTGQIMIPELGIYHYKARAYSPTLGRFMQTDPVGYDDQVNLYAYVANDPVNKTDPTGTESNWLLRALVPGQVAWDDAVDAASNGDWGSAAGHAATMVAEQVFTVATLGQGGALVQGGRAAVRAEATAAARSSPAAERTYQTYTKTNARTGEVYSGRTSGTGWDYGDSLLNSQNIGYGSLTS